MALAVVVTRDVADRFRGFLSSVMLEVAPSVYVSPEMDPGVRSRVWTVLSKWYVEEPRGSVVMIWRDPKETGGLGIGTLGTPPKELVEIDGLWLAKKSLPPDL